MKNYLLLTAVIIISNLQIGYSNTSEPNESDILIVLSQTHPQKVGFEFITKKIYGCMNCLIDYRLEGIKNNFTISLPKIILPSVCLTAMGPAKAEIEFNTHRKFDTITFQNALGSTKGTIIRHEGKYTLVLQSTDTFRIVDKFSLNGLLSKRKNKSFKKFTLNLVDKGLIWGKASFNDDEQKSHYDKFIKELIKFGAKPISLSPGYYSDFHITLEGDLEFYGVSGSKHEKTFYFKYDESLDELRHLLRKYHKKYIKNIQNIFYITIRSGAGEKLISSHLGEN